jgi:dipicolinate synthase subunit B
MSLEGKRIGFAVSGSFCTFSKAFEQAGRLREMGAAVTPVMSFNAASLDTRFGRAADNVAKLESLCGSKAILTLEDAEPIGPKGMFDIYVICPCTATTMGKLANAIYDTPVTLGAKSHLRGGRPVLIALSTNDGLSASAGNIGKLTNTRHYYFVPFGQDNAEKKPNSLTAQLEKLPEAAEAALEGRQLQPVIC